MALAPHERCGNLLRTLVVASGLFLVSPVAAQFAVPAGAVPAGMSPDQMKAMMRARGGPQPPPTAEQPKPEEKKEGEEKKDEDKDKKKEEDNSSIKRPEKPPRVPDPREFDVKPDKTGRVPPFNFIGQTWPDVLQWLATISSCSLDWQELPNDYLNLTTQKSYSLDEVRDLINRHLHARGYTLLVGDGILSVFKIEKLDPSLVPRVTEDELYDRKPYDFVKVSFELPEGMEVDKAKEDVKQVLSPQAKVFPLVTTRRLLVIDAVANQRLVSALLNEEREFVDGLDKPRIFHLQYARADKVVEAIYVLFGLDPKSRPSQMDLQVQQQKLQLMTQMQQQGKDVSRMLQPDGPKIYLAVNRQTNSILANAPPELMPTIERAVKALDVPAAGSPATGSPAASVGEATAPENGDSLRLEKYQLVTIDPSALQLALEEIGNLDPRTQLQVDTKSKTLFARATEADHKKITAMRDQLDGTGRQLKVIWLPRRLPADAVAGSIVNLMAGQEEEVEEPRRPFFFYDFRNQNNDDKPKKGFRVDADVENNRLLLWANDAELAQVQQFLGELTEDAPNVGGPRPVRVIAPMGVEQRQRLLEQLRTVWPSLGDNELIIDDQRAKSPKAEESHEDESTTTEPPEDSSASLELEPTDWRIVPVGAPNAQLAELKLVAESAPAAAPAPTPAAAETKKKSPITVTITPDGRLVVASQDQVALDRLEDLVDELSPPANRFKVFRLSYAKAVDVYANLKEYFEDELQGKQGQMLDWFGIWQDTGGKKEEGMRLSKRRTLRLIWDPPSNSILVANASPSQLHEIEQLINEYDQPASADSTKTRRTEVVKVQYSRASKIAAAIKDVYRDLLSSKDKEFDSNDRKQQGSSRESVTVIRYNSANSNDGPKKSAPLKVGFEGALSIGADDVSNVLLVSAQEEIFDGVVAMIHSLDEEARPRTTVQVHRVSGVIDAKNLQKALSEALGKPWLGDRPEQAEAAKPQENRDRGDRRDGRRDRDRNNRNND
ncbi:MAG: secretin N-terminal domain-containing protein [Pirellulales bacterium]